MAYIEWIELETFFSGYLLVYAVIHLAASFQPFTSFLKSKVLPKLSIAYAITGTLYLGLQLKNGYPDYHITYLIADIRAPYLKIWGLLSILLWIPALHKKAIFSILHSMVFFILLVKSFYVHRFSSAADNDMAANDMKIYSVSILINLASLILATLFSLLFSRFKDQNRSPHS